MILNESADRLEFRKRPVRSYESYLHDHRSGVLRAYKTFLKGIVQDPAGEIQQLLSKHDSSKDSMHEYNAYAKHFYPDEVNSFVKYNYDDSDYDRAWLHHQHTNPHHWQYWVLVRDGGELEALDMPFKYIVEMLCDWSSFQFQGNGTANEWYKENSSKMILSDNTRSTVEKLLDSAPEL